MLPSPASFVEPDVPPHGTSEQRGEMELQVNAATGRTGTPGADDGTLADNGFAVLPA